MTPWTAGCQTSLSLTTSQSFSKFMSIVWWYHPTISSSVTLFSFYLQSLPVSGSFSMSWLFVSGYHTTSFWSAKLLLKNPYRGYFACDSLFFYWYLYSFPFVFNFCYFNHVMIWKSLDSSCFGVSVLSITGYLSFSRLGKLSAIISSYIFSIPFSLSSPSETSIM